MSWIEIALLVSIATALIFGFRLLVSGKGSLFLRVLSLNLFAIALFSFVEFEVLSSGTLAQLDPKIPFYDTALMLVMFAYMAASVLFAHNARKLPRAFFVFLWIFCGIYLSVTLYGRWILDIPFRTNMMQEDGIWYYQLIKEGFFPSAFLSWFLVMYGICTFSFGWSFFYTPLKIDRQIKGLILSFFILFGTIMMGLLIVLVRPEDYMPFNIALALSITYIPLYLIYVAVRRYRIGLQTMPALIMEGVANPIIVLDNKLSVRFYNQKVAQTIGEKTAVSLIGQPLRNAANLFGLSPAQVDAFKTKILSLKPGDRFESDVPVLLPNGKRYYTVSFTPIYWMRQSVFGYILLATDLTSNEKNRQALKANAEQLQRSNQELSRFTQFASSDLKTPVRNIINYTKLIERNDKLTADKAIQEYLSFIDKNAHLMYRLIEDILQFSSINQYQPQTVNLNEVMHKVKELLQEQLSEKKAKLQYSDLPSITSNYSLMVLVFKNLIENGLKYNDKPTPMVLVDYHATDQYHEITFRDNGIGIDPAYQQQIFQIFKRLHTPDQYSGTGIGLAICKKIIDLHQGTLKLQSTPGLGSDFIVRIPTGPKAPGPMVIADTWQDHQ
jgi:signal transduction histidine kinase